MVIQVLWNHISQLSQHTAALRHPTLCSQYSQCRDGLQSGSDVKFKSEIVLSVSPWMAWSRHGRVGLLLFFKESNELLTVAVVVVSKDRKNKPNRKAKIGKTVPFHCGYTGSERCRVGIARWLRHALSISRVVALIL